MNKKEALKWFRKAAAAVHGHPEAQDYIDRIDLIEEVIRVPDFMKR